MSAPDSYFRLLCEQMGVALAACDRELNITTWNRAAVRLFGAAPELMIGTPLIAVLPAAHRESARDMLHQTLSSGEPFQLDFTDHDSVGEKRELACVLAPLVLESGQRVGASACFRDITARIRLQTEVDGSRKMSALGHMAGAVAHHFNNILGGIVTSVDFALLRDDPVTDRRVLVQTGKSLNRATGIIRGLLAFAEGDRRGEDLADVTEIVSEVADDLEDIIHEKKIALTVDLPRLPVIPIGRSQLLTVLQNITQNAVEAMPSGGRLSLEVRQEGQQLVIAVRDSGCGLDEIAMSHLFEPFFTSKKNLTTTDGQGAGLGLAIAHGIVQSMGGSIRVASRPAAGSCFTVTLPIPPSTT